MIRYQSVEFLLLKMQFFVHSMESYYFIQHDLLIAELHMTFWVHFAVYFELLNGFDLVIHTPLAYNPQKLRSTVDLRHS